MASFGLHKRGFLAPTYEEVLDSVMDDFMQRFGTDIVLTSNSNFGIIARLIAWRETLLIQELQKTYYSAFISTATESALDRIGANLDLPRKVATPSQANIVITTSEEYLIQSGEKFETPDGVLFELIKDVITSKDYEHNTYTGIGIVQSVETGDFNNVLPNTITIMYNPDENVLSVTNPEKAAGGQDNEDDPAYRARLIMENVAKPGPSSAGIKSALLNLPGVRQVNIIENPFADADQYGNPPYSVHVFCLGGRENDIADCLVDKVAAGITLTGTKAITAKDKTGNPQVIHFDYAKDKPVYAQVQIRTNDEWNVDDGVNDVKETIIDYISTLLMGETVHLTKIYPSIYDVPGVGVAKIKIGTDKAHMADEDIASKPFESFSCQPENIEVVVDGV
ncbi:baseplate J/gp47 family protein [Lactobacillus sp. A27]|uniref:baseplate J/gp47 family protein n=1 Tax=Lactobacillus sp. A27 TaxID=2796363 RepID=UPI001F5C4FFA|nr:baseplate J/gp47 family protein [Lactobacillus sp. A27]